MCLHEFAQRLLSLFAAIVEAEQIFLTGEIGVGRQRQNGLKVAIPLRYKAPTAQFLRRMSPGRCQPDFTQAGAEFTRCLAPFNVPHRIRQC